MGRRAKYSCPGCGAPVLKDRWDAGYQYCKDQKCFDVYGKKKVHIYDKPPTIDEVDISTYDIFDDDEYFDAQ